MSTVFSLSASLSPAQQDLGFSWVFLYYRARNVDRSPCCGTRYKLKLTHRFSRRGRHYTVGMLIQRLNSLSGIKMIVVDPGESLTYISSIFAAHSSSSHWPWQNYKGNMIIEWTATRCCSLYSIVFSFSILAGLLLLWIFYKWMNV